MAEFVNSVSQQVRREAVRPRAAPRSRLGVLSIALIVVILTYVWRLQDLYPILGTVKLPILASLAAIGFFVLDSDPRRRLRRIRHPIITLMCVLMGLAILSVPGSIHDGMSFRFIVEDYSKTFLMMVLIAASVRTLDDIKRYVAALVLGAFVYALYVQLNVSIGAGGRLSNLAYYDANDLGMMLVCTIPLALYFLIRSPRWLVRIAALATLGLMILVIVKTGSRGAFLAIVATSAYLLFRLRSVKPMLRATVVIGGVAGLLVVGSEQYWSMMGTLLNPQQDYNWSGESETGRMETWKRGLGYMAKRPILGVGVAAFPVAEGTFSERSELQRYGVGIKWAVAHNSFIQVGAELGVFGLLAFVAVLVVGYRTARERTRAPPGGRATDAQALGEAMAGSIVGYVVAGFFLTQGYSAYMMILLALIVGLAKVRPRPVKEGRTTRRVRRSAPQAHLVTTG